MYWHQDHASARTRAKFETIHPPKVAPSVHRSTISTQQRGGFLLQHVATILTVLVGTACHEICFVCQKNFANFTRRGGSDMKPHLNLLMDDWNHEQFQEFGYVCHGTTQSSSIK